MCDARETASKHMGGGNWFEAIIITALALGALVAVLVAICEITTLISEIYVKWDLHRKVAVAHEKVLMSRLARTEAALDDSRVAAALLMKQP